MTLFKDALCRFAALCYRVAMARYFIHFCFLSATVTALAWISVFKTGLDIPDMLWYFGEGQSIAAGQGYVTNGMPTAEWPVGYPAFLGALFHVFGASLLVAKLGNVCLFLGILWLSYRVAKTLFQSEFVGRMTLFLLATSPDYLGYTSQVMTEMLFVFLMMLGTFFLVCRKATAPNLLAAGVVFALDCLVRPQVALLPALLLLDLFLQNRNTLHNQRPWGRLAANAALVYLAFALALLPWTVRNYQVFHAFVFVSNNSGENLLIGNNPLANGSWYVPKQIFNEKYSWGGSGELYADRRQRDRAIGYIRQDPLGTVLRLPKKVYALFVPNIGGPISGHESRSKRMAFGLFKLFTLIHYLLIMGLFLTALLFLAMNRFQPNRRPVSTAGLLVIGYFTAVSLVTFGQRRYRFPLMPWIFMYVAALIELAAQASPAWAEIASQAKEENPHHVPAHR